MLNIHQHLEHELNIAILRALRAMIMKRIVA